MQKVKSTFKQITRKGFSSIEVILALALLSLVTLSLASALSYGIFAQSQANQENKANLLAEEGLEAVANIKDAAFSNLVNGTYGIAITGGTWGFLGTSDSIDGYTRSIVITTIDTNTRQAVVTVTWTNSSNVARSINATARYTDTERFVAPPASWTNPLAESSTNMSGNTDGLIVETAGNFAYVARAGNVSNFTVYNITTPAAPIELGTISVNGTITDMEISGNYVYLTSTNNTQELFVINVTNPASPSFAAIVDLAGTADANGISIVGTRLYLVRASSGSNELNIYNIATPSSPTLLGSFDTANTDYKIYVNGNYAYVAASTNNAELSIYNISNPASITFVSGLDLAGNTDATGIAWYGSKVAVLQGNTIALVNVANPLAPALLGTYNIGGTGAWISADVTNSYIFLATGLSPDFRVIDVTNPASPTVIGSLTYGGSLSCVYYDSTLNRVFGVGNSDTEEFVIYKPN